MCDVYVPVCLGVFVRVSVYVHVYVRYVCVPVWVSLCVACVCGLVHGRWDGVVIVSLRFPHLTTLRSTPPSLEAVPGAGPSSGEERSGPTCDVSEGDADADIPWSIWGRKTRACCRGRSGVQTDQHPVGKPGRGVVSFTAPAHLSCQGSDPWKSRLAFSLHTHMHIHTHTPPPPGTPPPLHTHRRR